MAYTVYILRNNDDRLYIGQTNSLDSRLARHHAGRAARYTSLDRSFHVVYSEEYSTQLEAMRRERQLKRWTRAKKEALIAGDYMLLKRL